MAEPAPSAAAIPPAARRAPPPLAATRVAVSLVAPATRLSFRGGTDAAEACGAALGFALPREACRAAEAGNRAALWLGPDEWLIFAPEGEEDALAGAVAAALGAVPHSLVDVSHRQVGFRVEGREAPALLNAGCPLDLDVAAFPVGMCTRTLVAKCDVVLWRRGADLFRLEVNRSFADYLAGILREAERGIG